jgi:hypothetical protein
MKTTKHLANGAWVEIEKITDQIDYREAYTKHGFKCWAGYYKKGATPHGIDTTVGRHSMFKAFGTYEDGTNRLNYVTYCTDNLPDGETIGFEYGLIKTNLYGN